MKQVMKQVKKPNKRLNKTVGLGDAVNKIIAPALQKRGFASKDIITHWQHIAPTPYNKITIPDKLHWNKGNKSAEGAILYLRCEQAHKMALSYESEMISAAINRYFGYLLVEKIKISAKPFSSSSGEKSNKTPIITKKAKQKIEKTLVNVKDEALKQALQKLGEGVLSKQNRDKF